MKRIVVVALALALLLAVVVGMLVNRALRAIDAEERLQHEAVGERLFDQFERRLSDIVRREEERPFAHYRYFYVPEDAVLGSVALNRSPLAEPPAESWNLGYFQCDPDGTFATPMRPENTAVAQALTGWTERPEVAARFQQLAVCAPAIGAPPPRAPRPPAAPARVDLAGIEPGGKDDAQAAPAVQEAPRAQGAAQRDELAQQRATQEQPVQQGKTLDYQSALRSFNKGQSERWDRKVQLQKVNDQTANTYREKDGNLLESQVLDNARNGQALQQLDQRSTSSPSPSSTSSPSPSPSGSSSIGRAPPPRVAYAETWPVQGGSQDQERPRPAAPILQQEAARPPSPPAGAQQAAAVQMRNVARQTLDASVGPLRPRRIDGDLLALVREVRLGDERYRQGLVLRTGELRRWLEETEIDGALRGNLAVLWHDPAETPRAPAGVYAVRHRFAEPFGELAATAFVQGLPHPGSGSRRHVAALVALFAVAAAAGIAALLRMVQVRMQYVQRRSDFVAAVTHELKTPLTAIRLYGEMLRDGMVVAEERRGEYYRTITAECERLSRLVENVLELARLEKGRRAMEIVVGDVAPLLQEAALVVEPHARACGFAVEVEIAAGLPSVRFDRDALLQVVINLVDNALKFARDAERKVVVLAAEPAGAEAGGGVRVRVRDRGPGVPGKHLDRIFEPFFRGERELTRTTKGTGIGLTLVRGLVERMGGRVAARNHPEGGFEIEIRLGAA